jgi:hypothetical protein
MRWPFPALVPLYLVAQAVAIGAWWTWLWLVPDARAPFVVGAWPEATLLAFALPDVAVLVLGSLAAAWAQHTGHAAARPLVWLLAGAILYATLWCVGCNVVTGAGWLSTAMMLACSAGIAWVVWAARAPR